MSLGQYIAQLLLEDSENISYIKPNFETEWEEAIRYPEFKKLGKEEWIKLTKQGNTAKYSEIKSVLGNVDLDFKNLEEPKKQRFNKAFKQGKIELPIAVKFNDQDYDLVAGNTRLAGLVKNDIDPKIWIINIPSSLNEYSEKVINQLADKFTQENPELSTEQAKEYIKRFDQIKGNLQPDKRDISKYSWNELEQAIAANQPKRVKAGKLNDGEPEDANLIYNQDGLRVYIGKTKQACIKYGNGYNFCISSRGSDNLYHDYRHGQEGTPYFVFDDTKSSEQDENGRFIDPLHLVVVFAFKTTDIVQLMQTDPDYPEEYSTTDANNDETDPWENFTQMVYHYPRLKRLKHLLKPVEVDPKEKAEYDIYKIYQKKINRLNNDYVKEYGNEEFWDKQYTFKDIQTANDKIDDILSGKIKPYKFSAVIEDLSQVLLGQKENKYVTNQISQNRIVKAGSDMKDEYKKFAENVLMNLVYSSVSVTLEDVLNDWDIEAKEINTLETYIKEIKELVDEYRKELAKIKLMKEGLQRLNESETGTIQEFIKYACKNLAIQNPPRSLTLSYDTNQVKDRRSFGYFDPNDSKIWVYVKNRNMADILRTLAHELVHHKQNLDGRISYESGKTGSDIENEANAKAGILLRDFGKQNDEIYQ